MTTLLERPGAEVARMPRRTHITETVIGTAGVLAAIVGAWMYYVPADWFLGGCPRSGTSVSSPEPVSCWQSHSGSTPDTR